MEVFNNIIHWLESTPLLGAIVNFVAVMLGAAIGLLLKKGISERIGDTVMKGLALCVLLIGVQGMIKGEKTLVIILSVVLGGLIGELLRIDDGMKWLGDAVEKKFKKENSTVSVAEGFVTASLLFIVGAMAVVGSLESGLKLDHNTAYAKSMLDFVSAMIFASSLGVGVLLSAFAVLIYQGGITLFAGLLAPVLSDAVITEMSAAGSVIIVGLALNLLGITKIKVANYIPAIFLPILFCTFL